MELRSVLGKSIDIIFIVYELESGLYCFFVIVVSFFYIILRGIFI